MCCHQMLALLVRASLSTTFVSFIRYYYSHEGFDSLYLRDGSKPAAQIAEWAIADPSRCTPLGAVLVPREIASAGKAYRRSDADVLELF